jgi:ankyrin repeat protein
MMEHPLSIQTLMWARRAAKAAGWSISMLGNAGVQACPRAGEVVRMAAGGDEAGTLAALAAGGDPMEVDADGANALMWTAYRGNALALSAMLDMVALGRADARALDSSGANAIMRAASVGRVKCVAMLIPFSVSGAVDMYGRSALMMAAAANHAACVKLLSSFEDPTLPDGAGQTALMVAASMGCYNSCEVLCQASDPRLATPGGVTALSLAKKAGPSHHRIVALIEAMSRVQDERDELELGVEKVASKGKTRL